MTEIKKITTTCTRDCPNTCGLVATVENDHLTDLQGSADHPLTRGLACHKTKAYIERVYSPERITTPLRRTASGWQKISWDEALDTIAAKMKEIRDQDGPEGVLYYQGYGERTALKLLNRYFFNLFGGVTTLRGSLCGGTGQAAQNLDFGNRISHDPLDHLNSKAMILWARNPVSTNISLVPIIQQIKQNGGRIIVIDPFRNRTAKLADRYIAPAPGRDLYLALAAARIIFAQGAEDTDFMSNHAVGAENFRSMVMQHSFTGLCEKAGVSADAVEDLAATLISCKPASILLGWGLHRHKDAHYGIRAIDALGAISGNIGRAGGGISQGFEEYGPYDQQYWGDQLNPQRRTLLMPEIADQLQQATNPPVRLAFISAANPVCMAPDSTAVSNAFKQMEMVVYCGHFMDDTAELADIFLPATTFLEEDDVMASYGHNYVGPVNKAIPPRGECRSDFEMFSALARRFPFAEQFCLSREAWLQKICAPIQSYGCGLEQLRNGPFRLPQPMVPYENKQFPTRSGKFEFMTTFDEDTLLRRETDYPYTLLTVAAHHHICSERTLAEHSPLPELRCHPTQAQKLGLTDGQPVIIRSPAGSLKARLIMDVAVRPDCVVAERGGWIKAGHGFNLLTQATTSTLGNGTPYYETKVSLSAE